MIQPVVITVNRDILAHQLFTGISRQHLACLVEELADPWQAVVEGHRYKARGGARKREARAGARHRLVFVDRLVVMLFHLRHDLPHSVLALLSGVDRRSTVTRAIGEIRGLLAERECVAPDRPGLRLRILADVFAYAQAEGIELPSRSRHSKHRPRTTRLPEHDAPPPTEAATTEQGRSRSPKEKVDKPPGKPPT